MALTWGSTAYSWSNWRIIICLIPGFAGMVIFYVYEASPWCPESMMPPYIFGNRTSFAVLILSFIHNMFTFWVIYFIPVYFQSVNLSNSTRTKRDYCCSNCYSWRCCPSGRYQLIHVIGMGLDLLGLGLFTLLDADSSNAEWIVHQNYRHTTRSASHNYLVCSAGQPRINGRWGGHATWAFIPSYDAIWGISIPAAIFNTQFRRLSSCISDVVVAAQLASGESYSYVSVTFMGSLDPQVRKEECPYIYVCVYGSFVLTPY